MDSLGLKMYSLKVIEDKNKYYAKELTILRTVPWDEVFYNEGYYNEGHCLCEQSLTEKTKYF